MRKVAIGTVIVVGLLAVAAISIELDATSIGRRALSEASAATHIRLRGTAFRFNLLRGLRAEGIEAGASFPSVRYHVAVPEIYFEPRMVRLLRREVDVDRIVLARPSIELVYGLPVESRPRPAPRERSAPAPERSAPSSGETKAPAVKLVLTPTIVAIQQGTILVRDAGHRDRSVTVSGLELTLNDPAVATGALTLLHAVTASGTFAARELAFGDNAARDIAATLSMTHGRVDIEGRLSLGLGALSGTARLDFNSLPFRHRIAAEGRLVGVPGVLSVEVSGFGLDAANLSGDGRLAISEGRFAEAPLWNALELVGRDYDADNVAVTIENGAMHFEGAWLRGTVDFEGNLDLDVRGRHVTGTWTQPALD